MLIIILKEKTLTKTQCKKTLLSFNFISKFNYSPCHYSCKLWTCGISQKVHGHLLLHSSANMYIYMFFHFMTMIQPQLNLFFFDNHDQLTTSMFQVFWIVKLNLTSSLPLDPDTTFPSPPKTKEKWSSQVWSLERRGERGLTVAIICFLPEYRIKWNEYLWANNHSILKSYLQEKKFFGKF